MAVLLDGFQAHRLGLVLDVLQGIAVLLDGFQAHRLGLVLHAAQGVAVLRDGFQCVVLRFNYLIIHSHVLFHRIALLTVRYRPKRWARWLKDWRERRRL